MSDILEISQENVALLEVAIQGPIGPPGIPGPSGAGVLEIPFAFGDATPKTLLIAAAGKLIYGVAIHISTAFNGTGPVLQIGDAGDPARFMKTTENDPAQAAT